MGQLEEGECVDCTTSMGMLYTEKERRSQAAILVAEDEKLMEDDTKIMAGPANAGTMTAYDGRPKHGHIINHNKTHLRSCLLRQTWACPSRC